MITARRIYEMVGEIAKREIDLPLKEQVAGGIDAEIALTLGYALACIRFMQMMRMEQIEVEE